MKNLKRKMKNDNLKLKEFLFNFTPLWLKNGFFSIILLKLAD